MLPTGSIGAVMFANARPRKVNKGTLHLDLCGVINNTNTPADDVGGVR